MGLSKTNILLLIVFLVAVFLAYFFFIGNAPKQQPITWGVDFSQMQAESLKLDWKKTYLAILEDLGAGNVKLHTQWDWVEGKRGEYYFDDIDWQMRQAEIHNAKIIYVVGMKTGRWPECHVPTWAASLSKQAQQDALLAYIKKVVARYKNSGSIIAWQAENEPLFQFGQCPWYDKGFLTKEVALIKSLDPVRPVIVSDSGEQSLWLSAAQIGDMVGVTTYRKAWFHLFGDYGFYVTSPFAPGSYWIKSQLVNWLFHKKVIGVELQAEPWTFKPFYDVPVAEQEKTMNLNQFKANITYAKNTGLDTFYWWGAEWWYWLKEKQGMPEIWNEAKKLFSN